MAFTFYNTRFRGRTNASTFTATPLVVPTYTVDTAPEGDPAGSIAYITDGAGGDPILAFSNGTAYRRSDTGGALDDGE